MGTHIYAVIFASQHGLELSRRSEDGSLVSTVFKTQLDVLAFLFVCVCVPAFDASCIQYLTKGISIHNVNETGAVFWCFFCFAHIYAQRSRSVYVCIYTLH